MKLTLDDFDDYVEQLLVMGKGRSVKIRSYIKKSITTFIVKTQRGEFTVSTIESAINIFNDKDN